MSYQKFIALAIKCLCTRDHVIIVNNIEQSTGTDRKCCDGGWFGLLKYPPENHMAEPPVLVVRIVLALMETDNSRSRDQASSHVS